MRLDGGHGHIQPVGDFLIGVAAGDFAKDIQLALGELVAAGHPQRQLRRSAGIDGFAVHRALHHIQQAFALLFLVPEALHADLLRPFQIGTFRHGGHDDDFDLRKGALDPRRRVQPVFAVPRNHVHQDEIHRETQAVNVRQRGVVNRERQFEPLGGLHPQFKQLAGHGLILDDHHLVFHSIACLSRCKISVS